MRGGGRGRGALTVALGLVVLVLPAALNAQDPVDPEPSCTQCSPEYPRREGLALMGGIGNSFAWFGVSADYYFADERFSAFGSVGYIPETDDDGLYGPTVAGGLRAYRGGHRHRGFMEVSVSEMSIERVPAFQPDGTFAGYDIRHNYGPALQVGYRFAARGGFTLMVQGGVGYDVPQGDVVPLLGFGMGYTWP